MSRSYHLGDVLTITTGRLISPRHMDGVYDILNYLTGDDIVIIAVPRAIDECRPWVLRQHPQLASITGDDLTVENGEEWLAALVGEYGEYLEVTPIPPDAHVVKDPLTELQEKVPGKPIDTVIVDDHQKEQR